MKDWQKSALSTFLDERWIDFMDHLIEMNYAQDREEAEDLADEISGELEN